MSAHPSAFAPLANRAFLGLWIANLLSNIGGWMQTTGAAWEMTSLTTEPIYVALLSAASTLPKTTTSASAASGSEISSLR